MFANGKERASPSQSETCGTYEITDLDPRGRREIRLLRRKATGSSDAEGMGAQKMDCEQCEDPLHVCGE
jgi:hypothetical protein